MAHFHHLTNHIGREQKHLSWDNTLKPVLTISSGETVTFDAVDGGNGLLTRTSSGETLGSIAFENFNPGFGPVYISDAQPGDVLKVEILDLETGDWGWTGSFPSLGALREEFPKAELKIWELPPGQDYAVFKEGIHIPKNPFFGVMGVAPAEEGAFGIMWPRHETGGNFDCRYLGKGATAFYPVKVPGALFSCGDGHFAQGDGEVCGSAIETELKGRLRFTVEKNMPWVTSPHFIASVETQKKLATVGGKGDYGVVAFDAEQGVATKKALLGLVEWLVSTKDLTRLESYMLLSVAGTLKIMHYMGEGVPIHTVSASIPLGVFVGEKYQ